MPSRPNLRKGDISLQELYDLSILEYRKGIIDNKKRRERLDVKSAKVSLRTNLQYDRQTKSWQQTGRNVKIVTIVRTKPISYEKKDSIVVHVYPVTFIINDFEKGLGSSFRFRSGGLKKWRTSKKKISEGKTVQEKDRIRRENQRIAEWNIRQGLDGSFIFELMWVLNAYGLLYGPLTCKRVAPMKTNPHLIPAFDKHSLFCFHHVIRPLLTTQKGSLLGKLFKS